MECRARFGGALEEAVAGMRGGGEEGAGDVDGLRSVEGKVDKLMESVERQRTECLDVRGCVQDAVAEKLREDNLEAENVRRRRCNVVIHGLG